jgi:hypothetical protein
MPIPLLSKSRFLAGLQCPLRLWYASFEPDLASEPSSFQKALFDTGHRVGKLARERYPGGVLITEDHRHHQDAIRSTREALNSPQVSSIFEAAFTFDDIRIRTDILERAGRQLWNLIEVKSGTSVKDENVYDVAIQYYVLHGLGFEVRQAGILNLNREYLYDGRKLDLKELFVFTDLKERVREMQEEIASEIQNLKAMLAQEAPPRIDPSRHCRKPYPCEYFDHCGKGLPDYWVSELSGIRQDRLDELAMKGILDIRDMPESIELSALQARIRECVINNAEWVGADLGTALTDYEHPIHFLDFEAVAPAIPRYANTRPYQMLPFQCSDHILSEDDALTHREYLCVEDKDPREEVARTLLESLGKKGSICTYTAFESQVITDLANHLPQYRDQLDALLERCRDLYDEIRRGYYHPGLHGSFSIKNVLPVLVPSMSYEDLSIQEGGQAGLEYLRMIDPATPPREKETIRRALLEYCRKDTLAMVRIREVLLERAIKQNN